MNRVLIVGGGWAGLSAATQLALKGWKTTLVERARELGGRSNSFWDGRFGEWLDNGPHIFIGAYSTALSLLQIWGSSRMVDFSRGTKITWLCPDGIRHRLDLGGSLVGAAIGLTRFRYLTMSEKAAVAKGMTNLSSYHGEGETVEAVLQSYDALKGGSAEFFRALTLAVMNCPMEYAAAAPMAGALREGLLGGGRAGRIGVPVEPLRNIVGVAAKAYLQQQGVDIRTGCMIKAIHSEDGGFHTEGNSFESASDVVILALSPTDIRRLSSEITDGKILPLPESVFSFTAATGVHFTFDRPILDVMFAYLSGGFGHWIFGRGEAENGCWRRVSVIISNAPDREEASNDALIKRVLEDLRRRLPAARKAGVEYSRVIRTIRATVRMTPEANSSRPSEETGIPGLFLAGDWLKTGLPATIEGAARSGCRAASLAAEYSVERQRP